MSNLPASLADRYRIGRELGRGGMATVYLGEDLKHERSVAIKVLKPELASALGAERFLAEIRTTAGLQHPNILPLHDSGSADGLLYYVMPYVEGESLRDRLEREGQLPVDDAVRIAIEVASALDYAHRKGIIHRDIKPENILLHDNRALVADFGIALAASRAGADRLTGTGLSLGTPRYMSPEQTMAERLINARSDIYSLGCVTYEMLAGTPPHSAPTAQALVAKVLTEPPPPLRAVRPSVTHALEDAVLKALAKVPADRWRTAAEFAAALTRRDESYVGSAAGSPKSLRARRLPLVAGVATLAALAALGAWGSRRSSEELPVSSTARLVLPLDSAQSLAPDALPFDVSPDGSAIVYAGESGGKRQLYLRPLASFESRPLPGTEGARHPFFSPDGRWIAFVADGKLQKVARDGGAPIVLAPITVMRWGGADWTDAGTILYATGGPRLLRISEQGGAVTTIGVSFSPGTSSLDLDPAPVIWPRTLPGGRHALVTADTTVAILTLATGELRALFPGRQARYLATGHLLYDAGEGRVRLVPFDLHRLEVRGSARPAFEAFRSPGEAASRFVVSRTGTVVYVAGGFERTLVLTDGAGRATPIAIAPRGYRFPRFSPDGGRIAVTVDPRPSQIWIVDLRRGSAVPAVTGPHSILPMWSPDGATLAYSHRGIRSIPWPGTDSATMLVANPPSSSLWPSDWSATRGMILELVDTLGRHLVRFMPGDTRLANLSPRGVDEWRGMVSPDGTRLAYVSDISGNAEVYVRAFDGRGEPVLMSAGGGSDPRWTHDGRALVYRNGSRIMRTDLSYAAAPEIAGPPRELFAGSYDFSQANNWDMDRNGRFVFVRSDPATVGRLLVITNWFDELRR